MQGWIKLRREITHTDMWLDKPFSRGGAWVDLLLMASHKDKTLYFNRQKVAVQRGELVTSLSVLSGRWGWSTTKVRAFLAELRECGSITVRNTAKGTAKNTTITVLNYAKYQDIPDNHADEKHGEKHGKEKTKNTLKTHEQECKECKEDTPPPIVPPQGEVEKDEETGEEAPKPKKQATLNKTQAERFNRFWAAYPRKTAKGRAERAWKTIDPDDAQTDAILAAIRAAKQQDRRFRETQYTPHPTTWLNGKEWENQYEGESGAQYISPIDALANREFVLEVD